MSGFTSGLLCACQDRRRVFRQRTETLGVVACLIASCVLASLVTRAEAGEPPGDFYVSPSGSDSNPGTIGQPFATIDRARLAVRSRISEGISNDIRVYLRGGVYRIESPIVFDTSDSPTDDFFVHYEAFPGERPVISGGRQITNWIDHGDGTWTTIVPGVASGEWTFRELFVNGRRRQRARHPNSGFLYVDGPAVGIDSRNGFRFTAGDLPVASDLAGAELNMLHEWTTSRVRVANVNHSSGVLTTSELIGATGRIASIFQVDDHPRYAVENHPALLDAPGEWYLDNTTGVLTYRPMPGEFASTVDAVAPIATALLVVRGDFESGDHVRNLRFIDLAFEHCAWALPPGGYATYQSGYYEQRGLPVFELPTAVTFEVAKGCELIRTRISHCGGWGVMLGAWCEDCSLIGSVVNDIAGNGVIVGEDRYRRVGVNGPWWIDGFWAQVAKRNRVDSCLVQDCGVVFQDCAGIWVGLTEASEIRSNLVQRIPHSGISVGGLWNEELSPCRENLIKSNRIRQVMQLLSDGAGIYTVGFQPASVIAGNLISNIPAQPGLSQNNGIYLDEGSSGFQISDNGIFDVVRSPFKFHYAGMNTLIGNTMRLSAPGVEAYFLQSTAEGDIVRIDDVVIDPSAPPTGCAFPVCGEAESAGLLAAYEASIYFDRDGDGLADIDDACVERAPGDVSGDGRVDGRDVGAFVDVLLGRTTSSDDYCAADVDGDGIVLPGEVVAFVDLVLGSG